MYFDSFGAALTMDGHGPYVWSAYLLCLMVVSILIIYPRLRQRRLLREVRGELRRRGDPAITPNAEGS